MSEPLSDQDKPLFTPARPVAAEGARIGLVTCTRCGAALVIGDPADTFDPMARHSEWHESLTQDLLDASAGRLP